MLTLLKKMVTRSRDENLGIAMYVASTILELVEGEVNSQNRILRPFS